MWKIIIKEMNTTNKFTPTLQAKLDKAREEHKMVKHYASTPHKMQLRGWNPYDVAIA